MLVIYFVAEHTLRKVLLSYDTIQLVLVEILDKEWFEYPAYARLTYGIKQRTMFSRLACTCKSMFNILLKHTNPSFLTRKEKDKLVSRDTTATLVRVTRFRNGCTEMTIDVDPDTE